VSERHLDHGFGAATDDALEAVSRLRVGVVAGALVDPCRALLAPVELDHDPGSLEVDWLERRGPGDGAGEPDFDVAAVPVSAAPSERETGAKGAESSYRRPRSQSP
jgi:hypothetical protein